MSLFFLSADTVYAKAHVARLKGLTILGVAAYQSVLRTF